MINIDKLNQAVVLTDPYEHFVIEGVFDGHPNLYDFLINDPAWEHDQDESLFLLRSYNHVTSELQRIMESHDWSGLLGQMGLEYSRCISSFQGTNLTHPLGRHTDEPEITGIIAKVLLYITPNLDCGTLVHRIGNDIDVGADVDIVKVTPGAEGDMFLFKTSTTSFHSTDYTDVPAGTRRICLTGCFHA